MSDALQQVNEQDNQTKLSLPPIVNSITQSFIDQQPEMIFDLVDAFGSPMNLIFPQMIDRNIAAFKNIYKKNNLSGQIYFTSKPNKSVSIMRQASVNDVNIDVSSEEALKIVLGSGFRPDRIECTGPKNLDYLSLAVQQGVTINADNLTELKQAIDIKHSLGLQEKLRVFVRLSGFNSPRVKFTSQDGTFGVHVNDAPEIFSFLKAHQDDLDFQGFAYYWSSASQEQRVVALENALELTIEAIEQGLNPKGLNIGGGFHIQYANDRAEWLRYVDQVKESLLELNANELTWNNNGLGFRNEGGLIKGAANYVDHHMPKTSAEDFDDMINLPLPAFDGMSAAQILSDSLLELYIEPGRALLDQLGVTIGRVNFTKKSVNGETMVALDMNRSNLHSTHQKLLTDPIIFHKDPSKCRPCPEGVYYYGNLCVSYDIITYNKTFPDLLPEPGDLVMFINTAPYIMDFIESNTLHQSTGKKITIIEDEDRFRWFTDEKYKPAIQKYLKKGV